MIWGRSPLDLFPIEVRVGGKGRGLLLFDFYLLVLHLLSILHDVHEVGCGGTGWLGLVLPELAREVLPL